MSRRPGRVRPTGWLGWAGRWCCRRRRPGRGVGRPPRHWGGGGKEGRLGESPLFLPPPPLVEPLASHRPTARLAAGQALAGALPPLGRCPPRVGTSSQAPPMATAATAVEAAGVRADLAVWAAPWGPVPLPRPCGGSGWLQLRPPRLPPPPLRRSHRRRGGRQARHCLAAAGSGCQPPRGGGRWARWGAVRPSGPPRPPRRSWPPPQPPPQQQLPPEPPPPRLRCSRHLRSPLAASRVAPTTSPRRSRAPRQPNPPTRGCRRGAQGGGGVEGLTPEPPLPPPS